MTGSKIKRERFIASERLIVPGSCCKDFNQKAIDFRRYVNASVSLPRLQADIAVKALLSGSGTSRQTYEDTDNKKREFTGDSRPGVEKNDLGYRWEKEGTWGPEKRLVITPSYEDLNSISTAPNVGWIEGENQKVNSFEEMLSVIKNRPHIQISKYKVDPKTDDITPGSQKIIDPFSITSGLSFEERQARLAKYNKDQETKSLPGRSLASRIPGGTLVARAAAAFGILRDENNKFRCPPGTPAANQFTDRFGSNCFGFSPGKFARFAAREAQKLEAEGKMTGLRNTARNFFQFIYTDSWGGDVDPFMPDGAGDPAKLGRSPFYDAVTGELIEGPDWRTIDVADGQRIFRNGNIRAQDELARQDARLAEVYSSLGIDGDDPERAFKALETLKKINRETGGKAGWDLDIIDATRKDEVDSARLNPEEVKRYITARLEKIPNWRNLSKDEQQRLIDADVDRYYLTERAFMESLLDQFFENPSVMRFIGRLEYNFLAKDEAGSGIYGGRGQPLRGVIHFNPEYILGNQEAMLPDMRPDERLAITAIGSMSDTVAKEAVSDFLVNSTYAARHMAGLVDGPRSFTRHIGLHEISHAIQELAFINEIQRQIDTYGYIRVPVYDKNGVIRGFRKVGSIDSLTGGDVMDLMKDVADDINIDALNSALGRIEVVSNLAGSYPEIYKKGGEVWMLEVCAELWALRAQGIIYGEDIDAALEWMDKIVDGRSATDRAISDLAIRKADADAVIDSPPDLDSPDIPEADLVESYEEAKIRKAAERREMLKIFGEEFEKLTEPEMFGEAAIIAAQRDRNAKKVEELNDSWPEMPRDTTSEAMMDDYHIKSSAHREKLDEATADFEMYTKMYDDARRIWRKKYGVGARGELSRFDSEVERIRTDEGLFEPEEIERLARLAKLDDLKTYASGLDDKELIRAVADKEIYMKTLEPGSKEMLEAAEELDILREQYIENKKKAGDKRTSAQIRKELASEVEALTSPKPKEVKKFASDAEARKHAVKEQAALSSRISKKQSTALDSIGDPDSSEIAMMLKPELQPRVGRAINRRNARLKRLGLKIDKSSPDEASLEEQVENILIPAMEAIDSSSVSDPFEIEAVIDVDDGVLTGRTIGKEVEIGNLVSGRVLRKGSTPTDLPKRGKRDKATGKRKHKVIVQVREGDRGIFPKTEEGEQKFVIPPGKIRIVGRNEDGTLRAEISYQMDTVETVDSMAKTLEFSTGEEDYIWRVGATRRVQGVVDRYVASRRASGSSGPGPKSDEDSAIADTSSEIVDSVIDAGGTFGEPPLDSSDISDDSKRLSSGRDVFGPVETRETRKINREKKVSGNIKEVRKVLGGRGSKEFPELTRNSIDPEVARIISETPDEKLLEMMEDTAYKFHSGLDRRVRVRARQEDVDNLLSSGRVRSSLSTRQDDDGVTRRARRLSEMSPSQRERRLSSGLIESREALKRREQQEEEIATKAIETFKKIVDGGVNINDMSDDEVSRVFGGRVKRAAQKSVSLTNPNVYEVEDVDTAVALLMLRHHVIVKDADVRLTEQASKAFEDKVKLEAKEHIKTNHPRWVSFREKYLADNPSIDPDNEQDLKKMEKDYVNDYQADLCSLYDPTKNLLCSGHIGIDREKMPQTNGRTSGYNTLAIRMLKDGKAAGKFEMADGISSAPENIKEIYKEDIAKQNAKLVASGKPEMSEKDIAQFLYKKISGKHSIEEELSGKTAEQNREAYDSLSPEEKQWLYDSTNWNNVEVNLEKPFIDFLNEVITVADAENGPAVRYTQVDPLSYAPSQQQLVASKVAGTARTIQNRAIDIAEEVEASGIKRGTPEFRQAYLEKMSQEWFTRPILATKDSYILDGHHRWGGIIVGNRSLPEELQIPLSVNEVQTDIIEGLTLGKIFQEKFGIKVAKLGAELDWEVGEVLPISDEEISEAKNSLLTSAPQLVDDMYERGDYVQIGSVGLSNKPEYTEEVIGRVNLAKNRRPSIAARERERELNEAIEAVRAGRRSAKPGERTSVGRFAKLRRPRIQDSRGDEESSRLSSGRTVDGANGSFEREYFTRTGLNSLVDDEQMPVFGYVVHKSHDENKKAKVKKSAQGSLLPDAVFEVMDEDEVGDGLTALGDIEIVLKPGVSNRTAYGRGSAISSGHRPVKLNSRNRNDVLDSMINTHGTNSKNSDMDAMLNLISASIDGDMTKVNSSRDSDGKLPRLNSSYNNPREPMQAQILGGFDVDEIEQINYPFSKIQEDASSIKLDDVINEKTIAEALRNSGFTPEEIAYFYSINEGGGINTQSMQMLRNYRQAKKIKDSYAKKGFNNVKIAHPEGIDIENPVSHIKNAPHRASVEQLLVEKIVSEIQDEAEKAINGIRKKNTPALVSGVGSGI